MYILIISRGTPSDKYKMQGLFENDQAKALAKAGHKVVMASLDARSIRRTRKFGFSNFEKDGFIVRQLDVPLGALPQGIFYKLSGMALQKLYDRIVIEFGLPGVIHAHFTDIACIAAELNGRESIPFVITEHSSRINTDDIIPELKAAAGIAYHKADALVSVSPALSERIKKYFDLDSTYIPNIVDTETFSYLPLKDKKGFDFVSVGNLNNNKRMDLTIQSFTDAFAGNEDVKLTIFGGGPNKEKLQELVKTLKMEKQIRLMGLSARTEIAKKLQQSNAFVLASRSETFGVVYSEALSCGVPVIATRCGGPEGYIDESNGLMVDVDDQKALSKAMLQMVEKAPTYNRKAISDSIKAQFSDEAVANNLSELYDNLRNVQPKVLQTAGD